jgi:DNA-binding NtrC family response regulator
VRQLENVIERAVVLSEGNEIDVGDLPADLDPGSGQESSSEAPQGAASDGLPEPLKIALERLERQLIAQALAHHQGNRQNTAQSLGIDRSTLFNKMRKFNLS